MLRKIIVGAVVTGSAVVALAATNRPSGYVTICKIGETCSVPASTDVAFGAAGLFVHKVLNGSFTCSVATFGSDPAPSKSVKECSVPPGGGGGGDGGGDGGGSGGGGGGGGTGITGSSCGTNGAQTVVHETIRVTSGTFDGGCRRFTAGTELGDGGQGEGQDPVFRVENGATLRNVVIGTNGADGIHVYNGGTIDNVVWMDVGEDALTIKTAGTVNVRNITGSNADDKFFQINAASTLNVSNCIIRNAGKALRQNGGTTFRINVTFDRCDINTMDEGIFRTDSSVSTARITNSRVHDAGSTCIGPWSSCTSSAITVY
jgi:pectate lyase C